MVVICCSCCFVLEGEQLFVIGDLLIEFSCEYENTVFKFGKDILISSDPLTNHFKPSFQSSLTPSIQQSIHPSLSAQPRSQPFLRSVLCLPSNDVDLISVTRMFRYSQNNVPQQVQDVMRGWWCILGVSLVFVSCASDAFPPV
jgi:hypothetical protein